MYYCINKYHWTPSQILEMSEEEKAFIHATIDIRIESEKKMEKEIERKSRH